MRVLQVAVVGVGLLLFGAGCDGGGGPSPTPTHDAVARAVTHGDRGERVVALTFTVGDGQQLPAILSVLRAANVRATFAVTGVWAEAHVDLLLAMTADGHALINYTYDGRPLAAQSSEARRLALSRVETTVYRLSSRSTRPYFRPPGIDAPADIDESVLRDAAAEGFGVAVLWSFEAAGEDAETPAAIADRTLRLAEPGAIIELSADAGSPEVDALSLIIGGLRAQGYDFVTVPELLAGGGAPTG